jgi:hypothetical protein
MYVAFLQHSYEQSGEIADHPLLQVQRTHNALFDPAASFYFFVPFFQDFIYRLIHITLRP